MKIDVEKLQVKGENEIERALWRIEGARTRLLESLEEIDEAILDWRPGVESNSVGSLLYHIAAIEADWLFVEVLQRPFSPKIEALLPWPVRDEHGRLSHITGQSLSAHLNRLTAVRQALLEGFQEISTEGFRSLQPFEHYDVTPEWVLFHLTQHEAEHRGHIQTLISLAAYQK